MRYLLLLGFLYGCSAGGSSLTDPSNPPVDSTPGTPGPAGQANALAFIAGTDQKATVATELPQAIVVRVTDSKATPVAGQVVSFVVVSGGGSVFAGAAQSNDLGEARERWTLGKTAGEQVLEARAVDQNTGEALVFGRVTAIAEPGPVAALSLIETAHRMFLGQSFDLSPLLRAADQYGNPITQPEYTVEAVAPITVADGKVSSQTEGAGTVAVSSGALKASLAVTVIRDLTVLQGGALNYGCSGSRVRIRFGDIGDTVVTGEQVFAAIDSVGYDATLQTAGLWWTGTRTYTLADGGTKAVPANGSLGFAESPGEMRWDHSARGSAMLVSDSPQLVYRGGSACGQWGMFATADSVTVVRDFE